jgi:hypothetical protein
MTTPKAKFRIEGEDATAAAFRSVIGNANRASAGIKSAMKFAFAGFSVASITGVAARAIEMGDELDKARVKSGMSAKAISELAHAAKMSDVELAALSTSLKKMQVNLSEAATGGKAQIQTLAALGIELKDIKSLAADKQFELIADRISKLKDPADRARAATELLGKTGENLLPMFEDGARGIRIFREEAIALGKSMDEVRMKNLSEADRAIKQLGASWESAWTNFMGGIAPGITKFLNHYNSATWDSVRIAKELKSLQEGSFAGMHKEEIAKLQTLLQNAKRREAEAIFGPGGQAAAPPGGATGYAAADAAAKAAEAARKAAAEDEKRTQIALLGIERRRVAEQDYWADLSEMTLTATEQNDRDFGKIQNALVDLMEQGKITADQFAARMDYAFDRIYEDLDYVETRNEPLGEYIREQVIGPFDEMPDRATEAAMRARDSFNQFFLDPSREGIKDLGKDLVDTLRKSIADGLTDKLFSSKDSGGFGWGDALTKFGGKLLGDFPGFADGGDFDGRSPFLVGERGPEIIVPRGAGTVIPNHQLGRSAPVFNFTANIDARGATMDLAKALPGILGEWSKKTVFLAEARIVDGFSRGRY